MFVCLWLILELNDWWQTLSDRVVVEFKVNPTFGAVEIELFAELVVVWVAQVTVQAVHFAVACVIGARVKAYVKGFNNKKNLI